MYVCACEWMTQLTFFKGVGRTCCFAINQTSCMQTKMELWCNSMSGYGVVLATTYTSGACNVLQVIYVPISLL